MRQHRLTATVVCGLLAIVLAGGCTRIAPPGAIVGSKSDQARKQAEGLALSVVNGAANAQAKSIPELTKNGGTGRSKTTTSHGGSWITVISPTDVPTPIAPIAPTAPQSVSVPSPPQMTAAKDSSPTRSPPRPGSPAVIKEHIVSSVPYATEADAEDNALTNARDAIERRLAELDPPVRYRPSLNEIKNEFARKDSRTIHPPTQAQQEEYARNGVSTKLVYAEYDVEVTADQIRELRTRDRVTITLRVFSGLIFIALAGFLFLRADEWTKGYLTRWLACAAVVLVGGAAAALYFV